MSMYIDARPGDKVAFLYPDAGLYVDQAQCRQMLTKDNVYTIDHTEVHAFVTYVYLLEFPDQYFNSVMFEDINPETDILLSQDNYSQDNYSQDNYSQDNYSQDNYSQDNYSQDNYSQDNYSQDNYLAQEGICGDSKRQTDFDGHC